MLVLSFHKDSSYCLDPAKKTWLLWAIFILIGWSFKMSETTDANGVCEVLYKYSSFNLVWWKHSTQKLPGVCRDRIVFGITTTCAINVYHHWREFESRFGEVYSIQHYVIKFVSDLRQVDGFLRVLWFPPPIKLTATI